ncbi:MAG: ATP-binding protein [Proteobacteria bacterium]|nr:ATP-binding protein [Pseudomonadota bacterium]
MRKILPLHAFKRHGYIVASSGSGKSEFIKVLLYRELIKKNPNNSIIVIDPH